MKLLLQYFFLFYLLILWSGNKILRSVNINTNKYIYISVKMLFKTLFCTSCELCQLTKSSWGNTSLFHVQTNNDVIKLRFRTSHDTSVRTFRACASNYLRFSMPCFQLAQSSLSYQSFQVVSENGWNEFCGKYLRK